MPFDGILVERRLCQKPWFGKKADRSPYDLHELHSLHCITSCDDQCFALNWTGAIVSNSLPSCYLQERTRNASYPSLISKVSTNQCWRPMQAFVAFQTSPYSLFPVPN
ncbi:hypothetical protein BCR33DRAFT_302339 [Rhizoclosmatium globosum]|uniref:Uncharacterized protein n=1 Tax=Rhizoclosmatium globosum TaxID=329046 RepID=A0A1Y2A5X5_9FUNG|nr:hypothetical protein BCR33DRAFT_302339 [Rhizoclosmatium globosum]|eukprot:ORY17901.1 hypothetical protein BCR33DRAFT_302339 [Rhizoclosmatium globosum]